MSDIQLHNIFGEQSAKAHMSLSDRDVFTLPKGVRQIRVNTGMAWVSLGQQDVIVRPQEALYLHQDRNGVVVTALGNQRLEFDMVSE
ncbi:MAG: hypothetical protein CL610_28540 [Anaerolineaceae bacterium]|nr:hypothetical protein [Anaerolineaceae bacterium]